ncbi:hypothetical protein FAI40_03875 [Acetobacteraceae bacterium]|nr:hypothetical protein FAI40_03875 [Acetobacteraceae bacterium]
MTLFNGLLLVFLIYLICSWLAITIKDAKKPPSKEEAEGVFSDRAIVFTLAILFFAGIAAFCLVHTITPRQPHPVTHFLISHLPASYQPAPTAPDPAYLPRHDLLPYGIGFLVLSLVMFIGLLVRNCQKSGFWHGLASTLAMIPISIMDNLLKLLPLLFLLMLLFFYLTFHSVSSWVTG